MRFISDGKPIVAVIDVHCYLLLATSQGVAPSKTFISVACMLIMN